ncbi:MAG: helix-turn-helix transcriptional regulator [Mesorhizobium sp.]
MDTRTPPVGTLIREWRSRRRLSQLDLALDAEISQRHLSFLESGRSAPSRDMVLKLAEQLEVPLRERNRLLIAAGFAPHYPERPIQDPENASAMEAVELVLKGHEPFPALAIDRHWNIVKTNDCVGPFLSLVTEPSLLEAPINALRLSLHPGGLAPHILDLPSWRAHVIDRLHRQFAATGDEGIQELAAELQSYAVPVSGQRRPQAHHDLATILRLKLSDEVTLAFITTTTIFGTPLDVVTSELAIESFFPADDATARWLSANQPAS